MSTHVFSPQKTKITVYGLEQVQYMMTELNFLVIYPFEPNLIWTLCQDQFF